MEHILFTTPHSLLAVNLGPGPDPDGGAQLAKNIIVATPETMREAE